MTDVQATDGGFPKRDPPHRFRAVCPAHVRPGAGIIAARPARNRFHATMGRFRRPGTRASPPNVVRLQ